MQNIIPDKATELTSPSGERMAFVIPQSQQMGSFPLNPQPPKVQKGIISCCLRFIRRLFSFGTQKQSQKVASTNLRLTPEATKTVVAQLVQTEKPVFKVAANTLVTPMGDYAGKASKNTARQLAEKEFLTMDTSQVVRH